MTKARAKELAAELRAGGIHYAEARKWLGTHDWMVMVQITPYARTFRQHDDVEAVVILGKFALERLK